MFSTLPVILETLPVIVETLFHSFLKRKIGIVSSFFKKKKNPKTINYVYQPKAINYRSYKNFSNEN